MKFPQRMHRTMQCAALAAGLSLAVAAHAAQPGDAQEPPGDAQQQTPSQPGMMGSGMMGSGMMGGGMMGGNMMGMMHACQSMRGAGNGMSSMEVPTLPPGNEKLEAQMHAEMMQKMGEIAARYAQRVK